MFDLPLMSVVTASVAMSTLRNLLYSFTTMVDPSGEMHIPRNKFWKVADVPVPSALPCELLPTKSDATGGSTVRSSCRMYEFSVKYAVWPLGCTMIAIIGVAPV